MSTEVRKQKGQRGLEERMVRKVTARRIPESERTVTGKVTGKQIKEMMILALTNFNVQGCMLPDLDEIKVHNYNDQDGNENLILIRADYVDDREKRKVLNQTLCVFYNNTYNTGTECLDKSRLLEKVIKIVSPQLKITSITLVSFMYLLNPYVNDVYLMSQFWYNVMKIANPEMFK
jgi:hypothetical protein